jgi:hypothetical protein
VIIASSTITNCQTRPLRGDPTASAIRHYIIIQTLPFADRYRPLAGVDVDGGREAHVKE